MINRFAPHFVAASLFLAGCTLDGSSGYHRMPSWPAKDYACSPGVVPHHEGAATIHDEDCDAVADVIKYNQQPLMARLGYSSEVPEFSTEIQAAATDALKADREAAQIFFMSPSDDILPSYQPMEREHRNLGLLASGNGYRIQEVHDDDGDLVADRLYRDGWCSEFLSSDEDEAHCFMMYFDSYSKKPREIATLVIETDKRLQDLLE